MAVGFNVTDPLATLESYRQSNDGAHWRMATTARQMFVDFGVIIHSTKLIMDADGVVLYRRGYGRADADSWRQVLDSVLR